MTQSQDLQAARPQPRQHGKRQSLVSHELAPNLSPQTAREDLLGMFKSESARIGVKPSEEQIVNSLDDYARQRIVASKGSFGAMASLVMGFSDRSLRVIYRSDPALALAMRDARETLKGYDQEVGQVIAKHGSLMQAARVESEAEHAAQKRALGSMGFIADAFDLRLPRTQPRHVASQEAQVIASFRGLLEAVRQPANR